MISAQFLVPPSFNANILSFDITLTSPPEGVEELVEIRSAIYSVFGGVEEKTIENCLGAEVLPFKQPVKQLYFPFTICRQLKIHFPQRNTTFSFILPKISALETLLKQESPEYILRIEVLTNSGIERKDFRIPFE